MFFKTFVQRRSRRLIFIIIGYFLLILNSATTIEAAGKDIAFLNLCRYGTLDEIKAALDEGADPNSVFNGKYQPGLTPLMHAAEFNSNPDVLDALVKGGADVHDDIHGKTVLQHAIRNENRNVLRRILEIGVGAHEMVDAIDYAYSNCELDVIQMLLEASTGIKVIGIDEKTSFDEWEYKVIDVQVYQILSDVFEDHRARGSRQLGDFFRVEDRHGNIFDFDSGTSLAHHHMFKTDTWHYKNIGPTFTAIIPVAFDDPKEAEVLFLSPREEEKSRRDQTKIVYVNLKNTTAKSSVKTTNSKSPYVENVAARESEVKTREEEEVKLPDSVSQLDGVILDAVGREWPFKKILERAEKGVSEMQFLAGWGYDYGMPGLKIDYKKAAYWYEKSAGQGNAKAMAMLGHLYNNGMGLVKDEEEALKLWKQSLPGLERGTKKEDPYSMLILGGLLLHGRLGEKDPGKAFDLFTKAAELGLPVAMNNIGLMFYEGNGVEQDYARAMEWFKKAAELGYPEAMYNIGWMFYKGNGVEQDYARAMEWFKKAAELGYPAAMYNIGWMFEKGNGVGQDYARAMEWYKKAAELGLPEAMNSIGWMFEKGNGVEQDFDKAVEWYEKANALEDSSKVKPKGEIRIAKGIPYDARWQYSYIVDFYRDNVKALWKLEEIFELPVWTVVWEPGLGSLPFAVVFQGFFTNREGTIRKIFIFFSVFPERGTEILGIRHAFDGDFSFRGGLPGWLEYELEKFEGESSVKEQRENKVTTGQEVVSDEFLEALDTVSETLDEIIFGNTNVDEKQTNLKKENEGKLPGEREFPLAGRISASHANIRSGHSILTERIANLPRGKDVTVLDNWVSDTDQEGILKNDVTLQVDGRKKTFGKGKAVSILQYDASRKKFLLSLQDKNNTVTGWVTEENVKSLKGLVWYKIATPEGTTGWVLGEFLAFK